MWSPFVKDDATDTISNQVEVNYDLLGEIVSYLDQQIAYYNSPESIPDGLDAKPTEYTSLSVAYKHTARLLRAEREYLAKLIREVKR